jgi:hypothetical protein
MAVPGRVPLGVQLQQWDLNPATYAIVTISKLCCRNTKPIQAKVLNQGSTRSVSCSC